MNTRVFTLCCLAIVIFSVVPVAINAQGSNTIEVEQLVTGVLDTSPPTTPTGLSATAVSTSQINLSWNASTDNVGVVGYQVFRDSIFIATSTLASYSDTGLTASTTYDYTVSAFDFVFNISTTSATATATTLSEPVVQTDSGGGGGSSRTLYIDIFNVHVVPEKTAATLSWNTDAVARSRVSWGITEDYEIGQLSDISGRTTHIATLERLSPGLRYYVLIEALDSSGVVHDTFAVTFVTGSPPDSTAPSSISDFQAITENDAINLSWINPQDPDFVEVRIVRSDKFFPEDIFGGKVVYKGDGTETIDSDVELGVTYYYAVFARDDVGNYSSPAVATARLGEVVVDPFEEFPDAITIPKEIDVLSLSDFDFSQDDKIILLLGNKISVDGTKSLTTAISYEELPEVLKTIGVTLTDSTDSNQRFSFLLRIDKEKQYYSATIAPLQKLGTYPLVITILDFNNQRLKKIEGELVVTSEIEKGGRDFRLSNKFLFFLLLLLIIILLFKRRRNDKSQVTKDKNY